MIRLSLDGGFEFDVPDLNPCQCGCTDIVVDDSSDSWSVQVMCTKCLRGTDYYTPDGEEEFEGVVRDAVDAWNRGEQYE